MALNPDDEMPVFYVPLVQSKEGWAAAARWEADAIEAHLAVGANRPRIGQRKTVRLLRRLADYMDDNPTRQHVGGQSGEARMVIFNAPGHLCLRPNPARDDGLWPGGPFWMVGDAIYFHRQDALAAVERVNSPDGRISE